MFGRFASGMRALLIRSLFSDLVLRELKTEGRAEKTEENVRTLNVGIKKLFINRPLTVQGRRQRDGSLWRGNGLVSVSDNLLGFMGSC